MNPERQFLSTMWRALGGDAAVVDHVEFVGSGDLPSAFAVSAFAAAAVGAAGAAVAELIATISGGELPSVTIDRRLASLWFGSSIRPEGWALPSAWDPVAGDYAAADGWIRLHTNAPHHREAALAVLNVPATREQIERAVGAWSAETLEAAVVQRGGCAAAMRTSEAWGRHPQGQSVRAEPLVAIRLTDDIATTKWLPAPGRPMRGLRVLDLTRVLAGPIATRFLAGMGADVLRIDPPIWDEPAVVPDVTLGKRCARLDLHNPAQRAQFDQLLSQSDVLVHGYRADALEAMGLDADTRRRFRPGLVDVCLNAYGWSGPWRNRRGFDSLMQMSSGIAVTGMRFFGRDRPTPLPVQALDHATGYLMAAAVIRGLTHRLSSGRGFEGKASLARTAALLIDGPVGTLDADFATAGDNDWSHEVELTAFGAARRLRPPMQIVGAPMLWDRAATALGSSSAQW
ncbi:MAG: CoA transferase [Steroidobacteraceae bacterium]